jgi:hypothetical protein
LERNAQTPDELESSLGISCSGLRKRRLECRCTLGMT